MRWILTTIALVGCERSGSETQTETDPQVETDCTLYPWFADRDGDGYGGEIVVGPACEAPTGAVALNDDCNDADSAVNPSAAEICNGADDNCDGIVDTDAIDAPEWFVDADADDFGGEFVGRLCEGPLGTTEQDGDCADLPDVLPPGARLGPADVYPGAPDVPYDGVDADCRADNDFDRDGDLYVPAGYLTAHGDYVAWYGYAAEKCSTISSGTGVLGVCGADDCDDNDPLVHPEAADDVRDPVAATCEGALHEGRWEGANFAWHEPRNVVITRSDTHWYVVTASSSTDAAPYNNIALGFEVNDLGFAAAQTVWLIPQTNQTVQRVRGRIDALPAADGFYGLAAYTNQPTCSPQPCTPPPPSTYLVAKKIYWDSAQRDYRNRISYRQISTVLDTYADVDLRFDGDGNVWGVGCGTQSFAYVVNAPDATFTSLSKGCRGAGNCDEDALVPPDQCFVEPPASGATTGTIAVCDGAACASYDLDGAASVGVTSLATDQPHAALAYGGAGVDWQNGYRTLVPASGPGVTVIPDGGAARTLLGAYTVHATAAASYDGVLYVIGAVDDITGDGARDVVLAYGPEAGDVFEPVVVRLVAERDGDTFVFSPTEVSVQASAAGVLIAASGVQALGGCIGAEDGRCDLVAWQVLRP